MDGLLILIWCLVSLGGTAWLAFRWRAAEVRGSRRVDEVLWAQGADRRSGEDDDTAHLRALTIAERRRDTGRPPSAPPSSLRVVR